MHIEQSAPEQVVGTERPVAATGESRTRDRVARAVLEHGPISAADVACRLGLTPAAVRRHLDALDEAGLVHVREPVSSGSRGRGRPARSYVLTDAGHSSMTTAYDDLAASAMAFLAEQLGTGAVEEFAARRVAELELRYASEVDGAGDDVQARTRALADALARDGYAASARPVGEPGAEVGIQLCQGHCPVQQVAARFPQLCDAETEVFSRLLGVHVQRLATLARGAHVCTTHVPYPTSYVPHPASPPGKAAASPHETTPRPRTSDGRNPR